MKALVLGSGHANDPKHQGGEFHIRVPYAGPITEITRVDYSPDSNADVIFDLNQKPWPFEDNTFDEVHAYNIMEHLGHQGDARAFFDEHYEIWRVLKPLGHYYGCCPKMENPWVFAEPSHTRVLLPHSFNFLNRSYYDDQDWSTSVSDFRWLWKGDLRYEKVITDLSPIDWYWIMVAIKDHVPGQKPVLNDEVLTVDNPDYKKV